MECPVTAPDRPDTAWFVMWHCHCTELTTTGPPATRCPVHAQERMHAAERCRPAPGVSHGYQPADSCTCPRHQPAQLELLGGVA